MQMDDGTVEERVADFSFLKKLNKQKNFIKLFMSKAAINIAKEKEQEQSDN